ncbi:hypothetical protein GPY61_31865 [Massilia sp. NEAU-DD11]|uniref:Uncharacterized protein n=1 Tax=Massilia cellulosiltytica TaxID=2683234 RepID=A0A7X3KAX6_9BURK|nr:hypothetical protein [Telluria cellulosilytica]MVW64519.1 hypothetical protein [Telluria cellulosilytica]
MRKSTYQQLIDGLAEMAVPVEIKLQFAELIRRSAALDGVTGLDRSERVLFARRMLDLGEPRPVIRNRLMVRYQLGRSQAYGIIAQALQLSEFPAGNRTQTESNQASDERTPNESRLL